MYAVTLCIMAFLKQTSKQTVMAPVSSVTTTQTPAFQIHGHTLNLCTNQMTKYGEFDSLEVKRHNKILRAVVLFSNHVFCAL